MKKWDFGVATGREERGQPAIRFVGRRLGVSRRVSGVEACDETQAADRAQPSGEELSIMLGALLYPTHREAQHDDICALGAQEVEPRTKMASCRMCELGSCPRFSPPPLVDYTCCPLWRLPLLGLVLVFLSALAEQCAPSLACICPDPSSAREDQSGEERGAAGRQAVSYRPPESSVAQVRRRMGEVGRLCVCVCVSPVA